MFSRTSQKLQQHFWKILFCIFMLFDSSVGFSLEHTTELWPEINVINRFCKSSNWEYEFDSRIESEDHKHYFKTIFFESGLGYLFTPTVNAWFGYRWISHHAISGFPAINMLWEHIIWKFYDRTYITIASRTLFEERKPDADLPWGNRVRQRITLQLPNVISKTVTPVFFEEPFFNLSNTEWSGHRGFSQNRASVGLIFKITDFSNFQISYLNQYVKAPNRDADNKMNNIFSILYVMDFS